jgi:hypothetical protein
MPHGEIQAEGVPGLGVAIPQVLVEANAEIRREAHIVEAFLSIEGIYPMTTADKGADDFGVMLKNIAGDILKMLADQLCASFSHVTLPCNARFVPPDPSSQPRR